MKRVFTRQAWFSNIKNDVLSGAVVALALIPEAIAFSVIAGVDPKVGLYASFCMAIVISFTGGRPGMISAATAAMALLMTTLVKDYGLDYLLATTILTGILQMIWGWVKLGNQMRFVPRAVMVGFVNALAILIFNAQFAQLIDVPPLVYILVAIGLAIIYGLPKITTIVPSPLVAIVSITAASIYFNFDVPTVGDLGELPTALPSLSFPAVPLNFKTIEIILPYALGLSFVGLLDSFLTANVVDDMTDTSSDKNQEALGQGFANIIVGFLGGMAGCAMIGQSVININSGGRTRLSTLSAGVLLIVCILGLGRWVAQIPVAVLVAVMFMVAFSTFSWGSLKTLKIVPKSDTAVMITTVLVTILTRNLAIGVLIGVALSAIFFSRKIAALAEVTSELNEDASVRTYYVTGQIFFVSVESFLNSFKYKEDLDQVVLDLTHAHLWDQSSVDAVDKVVFRFRKQKVDVQLQGLNEASATLIERLAIHHKTEGELAEMPIH